MNLMRCSPLVLCAVLAIGARAQNCFQPDGFNGACCAPASGSFPVFPAVTLPGKGASLRNCGVDCEWNTTTAIAPTQVLCDYWLFAVSITGATPADPSFAGQVFLGKYARTWGELTPDGPIQVWRWIINSEVFYATPPAGAPTCKYPFSALPPFSLPVHFQGHVDYSFNCANGVWEVAMALTHLCTLEVHGPFSSHPLVVPPGVPPRTYQFVAPANFVFGPGPSAEGSVVGDAQRSSFLSPAGTYTCFVENPIVAGTLTTAN